MKVALLNQFYVPDVVATGQLLADVAAGLRAAGHDVHVVCSRGGYGGGAVADTVEHDGVQVHRTWATQWGRRTAWGRLCDWATFWWSAGIALFRLGPFDAVLALSTPPGILAVPVLLGRRRCGRVLFWCMDVWPDVLVAAGTSAAGRVLAGGLQRIFGAIERRATVVISLGAWMTRRLQSHGLTPARIVEVSNWVPGEVVAPGDGRSERQRLGIADDRFVVMYSGNMGVPHEFATVLGAAARLRAEPGVLFLFAGDGACRTWLTQQVKTAGLDNVRFAGACAMTDLSAHLAAGDVHLVTMKPAMAGCVVPSKVYGVLASGRPCVYIGPADSEPAALLAQSGAGCCVAPGDVDGLVGVIRGCRDDRERCLAMGRNGRAYYAAALGRARSVARLVELVEAG